MKKVAILTNIVPPYRLPLFNGITEKVDLDILVCANNEKNRNWELNKDNKFNVKTLFGFSFSLKNKLNDYRFIYLKFGVLFYLLLNNPDKLIIGDASWTSYFAAFCCKVLGIDYIWWNETLPYTPIKKGIIDKFRSYSIKNASHHFVSGTLAKEFIMDYGVDENRITIIPDAVDNKKYFEYYKENEPFSKEIRSYYGFNSNDFVILYVGQFIERKNIKIMLEAYEDLYEKDKKIKFIMVGGGSLKSKILKYKQKNHLKGLIVEDFMSSNELAKLYTIADLMILVSKSEPWGMVVNEAMCFGVPVLLSENVGAGADLVNDDTGLIVSESVNKKELVKNIEIIIEKEWNVRLIQNRISDWNNLVAIKRVINHVF